MGKETTPFSGTIPRSEAAPSTETTTGKTGGNGTSKNEPVTSKPEVIGTSKKATKNGETGDEETNVTPTPSKSIEPSSQKTGGGVQIYIIVVLVVIIVGYIIYVNKAKVILASTLLYNVLYLSTLKSSKLHNFNLTCVDLDLMYFLKFVCLFFISVFQVTGC